MKQRKKKALDKSHACTYYSGCSARETNEEMTRNYVLQYYSGFVRKLPFLGTATHNITSEV
jgi:hypothetical protein